MYIGVFHSAYYTAFVVHPHCLKLAFSDFCYSRGASILNRELSGRSI